MGIAKRNPHSLFLIARLAYNLGISSMVPATANAVPPSGATWSVGFARPAGARSPTAVVPPSLSRLACRHRKTSRFSGDGT